MTERQTLTRSDNADARAAQDFEKKAGRKLDLSLTQVAGGALAAMTTAALGSRLGVGGTIAGAALASVVAAVAGSLYTASLRTTREKVKTVWNGPSGRKNVAAAAAEVPATPTAAALPAAARMGWYSWRRVVLGAVAVFGLAGFILTGYEALAGQALSGGSGTTVGQVSSGRHSDSSDSEKTDSEKESSDEDEEPADASPSPEESDEDEEPADASPSPEESDEPEVAPSESGPSSSEPTAGRDEPSTEPTTAPTTESKAEAPAERDRATSEGQEEPSDSEPNSAN